MFDDSENQVIEDEGDSFVHTTEWCNLTDNDVILELHVKTPMNVRHVREGIDKRLTHREKTGNIIVTVPSKGSVVLSSDYDNAIQRVRNGIIMQGQAPQLVNKGKKITPKIHDSLNAQLQREMTAARETQIALEGKAIAELKLKETTEELARVKAANAAHETSLTDVRGQSPQKKKE